MLTTIWSRILSYWIVSLKAQHGDIHVICSHICMIFVQYLFHSQPTHMADFSHIQAVQTVVGEVRLWIIDHQFSFWTVYVLHGISLWQCRLDKASQCCSFEWPAVPSCWRSPARAWPRPRTWPTWWTATAGSSTSPPHPYGAGKVCCRFYFGHSALVSSWCATHNYNNVFLQETPITSPLQTKKYHLRWR